MEKWNILSQSERESTLALISAHFGCEFSDFEYDILRTPRDKLYLSPREVLLEDLSTFRIDKVGIYFGELYHGEIRLSIEGAQLIGPIAKKNVVEIEKDDVRKWLNGQELDVSADIAGFQIVKCESDFLGCGKASGGRLFNYIPKARRIGSAD